MRTPRKQRIPLDLIEQPLNEAWQAVDAMWRVELLGDAPLAQQWRVARNKLSFARQRFTDLQRLAKYLSEQDGQPANPRRGRGSDGGNSRNQSVPKQAPTNGGSSQRRRHGPSRREPESRERIGGCGA